MQAPFMALLSLAEGKSIITENIYENRFSFVRELAKMGADIQVNNHHAVITGNRSFNGAAVTAPDLRAGAGLIVAGLAAKGRVEISDIYHIERGYENFTGRLRALGADIELAEDGAVVEMALPQQPGAEFNIPDTQAGLS
jgi:UDP-N-acetylglucosamine 1-carboxyvinyltransferase